MPLLDFSTVDDFLRRTANAKSDKREAISSFVSSDIDKKDTVGLPPGLLADIETMLEKYGDEAYRQVALFCMGKWFQTHMQVFEELAAQGEVEMACRCLMGSTRVSDALHLLSEVQSIGGDREWKEMLKREITQHIMEAVEEAPCD